MDNKSTTTVLPRGTKINGPIRVLYKSKAKEVIANRDTRTSAAAKKRQAQIITDIEADPTVKPALQSFRKCQQAYAQANKALEVSLKQVQQLSGLHYNQHNDKVAGEVPSYRGYGEVIPPRFKSVLNEAHELADKVKHEGACACHIGDSPELLEFMAKLSLAKTVGDAEALLAALN
jgi:hypothetical protein